MIHIIKINKLKQYKVTITQTKVYNLTIEAENRDYVETIAQLSISTEQGKVIDEYIDVKPV
jgi:hypothetical protein